MKQVIFLIVCFFLVFNTWAQGPSISGDFVNVPFKEFTLQVEQQVPLNFYFHEEWTNDVVINARGEGMDLLKILRDHLLEKELSVVFLDNNKIVVVKGEDPVSTLPDFSTLSGASVGG